MVFFFKPWKCFHESACARLFFCKSRFFNPRLYEIEKIPNWGAFRRDSLLCDFPSRWIIGFRRSRHGATIPNLFGAYHSNDCLLLQRFALFDVLEVTRKVIFYRVWELCWKVKVTAGFWPCSDVTGKTDAQGNVTFAGRIGTIFKSGNAIYLGRSAKSVEYLFAAISSLTVRSCICYFLSSYCFYSNYHRMV